MRSPHRWLWAALAACTLLPASVVAQTPWTVTVTPTMNPLPVGACAAIQLTVFDASIKDVPRNPLGVRVTIAEFDIAVTTPNGTSAAAQRIDAYHWSACACQGAAAGTVATVTATYPARALDAKARVRGVELQRTATFVLSMPKGTINPPVCLSVSSQAIGASPAIAAAPAPQPPATAVVLPPAAPRTVAPPVATRVPPAAPPVAVALPPVAPVTRTPAPAPPAAPRPGTSGMPAEAIGAAAGRTPPYVPAPVTLTLALSANGSWYVPAPVTIGLALSAQGSWYVPAPVTVTLDLSATGSWIERTPSPVGPLRPAPPKP
ncbi:MAG TPA: hypothetical protein VI485_16860 [Vicinamibacterales bacterium]|nr:hypothetical protein [Vicinamibacterales bacterium]